MREIKFRAWDKKEKKMYYDVLHNISFDGVVMQYTGLKDKNRKEIYEGDILKLDSWSGLQIVEFIEGAFCLVNQGKQTGFTSDIHYIHHAGIPQAAVIGNIYENPELLKG